MGKHNKNSPSTKRTFTSPKVAKAVMKKPKLDRPQLQKVIHQKLDELQSGALFLDYQLTEKCYPALLSNDEIYNKFIDVVGKAWADIASSQPSLSSSSPPKHHDEKNSSSSKNKAPKNKHDDDNLTLLHGVMLNRKRKAFIDLVKSEADFVRGEIEFYKKQQLSSSNFSLHKRSGKTLTEGGGGGGGGDAGDNENKPNEKRHERKRISRMSPAQIVVRSTYSTAKPVDDNQKKKDSSQLTPTEQELFDKLDKGIKADFREVGFAKWYRDWLPIMQLSPLDLMPGTVRDDWFALFYNTHKAKQPMRRLCYWYGSNKTSTDGVFSLLLPSHIVSYEEGVKRGFKNIPPRIEKKLELNKKLSMTELLIVRGLKALEKDYHLPKDKRFAIEKPLHLRDDHSDDDDDDTVSEDESESESESQKTETLKEAIAVFEKKKQEVLSKIDDKVKIHFRQLGFAKWNKDWLPIIQLSPFDVSAGSVRDEWFHYAKKQKAMPRLCYFYGTPRENLSNAFSFINASQIISYSEGKKRGLHQLSTKTQKKIKDNKQLSKMEKLIKEGLVEAENDLLLQCSQRVRWIPVDEDYMFDYNTFTSDEEGENDANDDDARKKGNNNNEDENDDNGSISSDNMSIDHSDDMSLSSRGSVILAMKPIEMTENTPSKNSSENGKDKDRSTGSGKLETPEDMMTCVKRSLRTKKLSRRKVESIASEKMLHATFSKRSNPAHKSKATSVTKAQVQEGKETLQDVAKRKDAIKQTPPSHRPTDSIIKDKEITKPTIAKDDESKISGAMQLTKNDSETATYKKVRILKDGGTTNDTSKVSTSKETKTKPEGKTHVDTNNNNVNNRTVPKMDMGVTKNNYPKTKLALTENRESHEKLKIWSAIEEVSRLLDDPQNEENAKSERSSSYSSASFSNYHTSEEGHSYASSEKNTDDSSVIEKKTVEVPDGRVSSQYIGEIETGAETEESRFSFSNQSSSVTMTALTSSTSAATARSPYAAIPKFENTDIPMSCGPTPVSSSSPLSSSRVAENTIQLLQAIELAEERKRKLEFEYQATTDDAQQRRKLRRMSILDDQIDRLYDEMDGGQKEL